MRGRAFGVAGEDEKVHRDDIAALMQELEKAVLGVRSGIAPRHRRGEAVEWMAVRVDALAIGLHFQLLQERWQQLQAARVGDRRIAAGAVEPVHTLHTRRAKRHVVRERRVEHVRIHGAGARQQRAECAVAQRDLTGEADRRPERIAPAHPVPEGKHLTRAPRARDIGRRAHCHDLRAAGVGADRRRHPRARGVGVGEGFLRGESFRHDHDEGSRRIKSFKRIDDFGAVNVGGEPHCEAGAAKLLQRVKD